VLKAKKVKIKAEVTIGPERRRSSCLLVYFTCDINLTSLSHKIK